MVIKKAGTAEAMAHSALLRNMIVHRYWEVDDARIYREAGSSGLKTVERFIEEVVEYAGLAGDLGEA